MELLVERHDGRAMANRYMQQFGQAHREGRIDRDLAVRLLRWWRARSILADVDVSFGLAATISETLRVMPAEVEEGGDWVWEVPEWVRRQIIQEEMQRVEQAGLELRNSDCFGGSTMGLRRCAYL